MIIKSSVYRRFFIFTKVITMNFSFLYAFGIKCTKGQRKCIRGNIADDKAFCLLEV